MAHDPHRYVHLSIFLLLSLCVSGGIGSEFTYSCDLQLIIMSSTIPLGDKYEGKMMDCIQIGWIESQKQYGLKTGESAECSKALSSGCQKTDQFTSMSNDKIEFIKNIGNDAVGLKVNCKIDLDDAFNKPINVWQCNDDIIHSYYVLTSASHSQSTISKRDVMARDRCSPERVSSCVAPMKDLMGKPTTVAVNKEQLIAMCNVVQPSMRCLDDILRECSSSRSTGVDLNQMFSVINSTFNDLCNVDSRFSKDYLRHAPCMNAVKDRVTNCAKVKSNDRFPRPSDRNDSNEVLCCVMKFTVTCTKDVYRQHCGAEAGQMGYQMTNSILSPMVQEACIDSYGNYKCSGCNSPLSTSVVTSLLSLATLFFLFRRINHV